MDDSKDKKLSNNDLQNEILPIKEPLENTNKVENATPPKSNFVLLGIIVALIIFSLTVFVIVISKGLEKENIQDSQEQEDLPTEIEENEQTNNSEWCTTCIYYITEGSSSEIVSDDSVWQFDLSTNEKRKLSIEPGKNSMIYNFRFTYGGRYLAYARENAVWIYDTKEDKEKKISLTLPENIMGEYSLSPQSISPNGKYITYGATYYDISKDCGHEPCLSPDLYPDIKIGEYSYDIETEETVYLGILLTITAWAPDSKYVFTSTGEDYYEYKLGGGTFKIDVTTGNPLLIQNHNNDIAKGSLREILPIPGGDLVVLEGDPQSSLSELTYVPKTGENIRLDYGTWAEIQPSYYPNIDYSQVLYRRQSDNNKGSQPYFNLNRIDTKKHIIRTVYRQEGDKSFASFLTWKDKENVIIMDNDYSLNSLGQTRILEINILTASQKILVDSKEGVMEQ